MKTAEELLKEKGITPETVHHNYAYVYRVVCDLIEEAQKEACNQATEMEELIELVDRLVKDGTLFVTSIDWDTSDKTMGISVKFAMSNPQIYEVFKKVVMIQESQTRSLFEWQWKIHP